MMFDFKKEYKEFYMPSSKPQIVNVPVANYIAVRGKGDPNEEGGAYKRSIAVPSAFCQTKISLASVSMSAISDSFVICI